MANRAQPEELARPNPPSETTTEAVSEPTDQPDHPAGALMVDENDLGPRTRNPTDPDAAPEPVPPSSLEVQVIRNFNDLKRRGSLDVLHTLFRTSILYQRAALDKQYFSFDYQEYDDDSAAWTSLAAGLDQFCKFGYQSA